MNILWIFSFMFGLALSASLISGKDTFTALEPGIWIEMVVLTVKMTDTFWILKEKLNFFLFLAKICALEEDVGICLGAFEKWHFANGECTTFLFGGCGGNMNQFDSKPDCEKFCLGAWIHHSEIINK